MSVQQPASSFDRAQLVAAMNEVAQGSRPALAVVYERTSAKLFGICLRILGDKSEAEDALQDIYLNVWHKAGTFDPARASPITWLATLARNRSIDRRRANGARTWAPEEEGFGVADESPGAGELIAADQERRQIVRCLDELGDKQREAIRQSFFEGLSYPELAEALAVPLGTLKS